MSIYGSHAKLKNQFAFKDKSKHIAKIKILNITYPNPHIDIEIPMVQGIMLLCQVPQKLRLILSSSPQT